MKTKLIITTDDDKPIVSRDIAIPCVTQSYWECDCKEHFYHPASEEVCPKCLARAKNSHDALTEELLTEGFPIRDLTITVL